jgi:hypothetical protein
MGLLSLHFTRKETREGNGFNWFPIKEVAYLFAGIFYDDNTRPCHFKSG